VATKGRPGPIGTETKGLARCRCRPEGLDAASADPVLADLRDKAGGGGDAGVWH
jgi:hypothetical protein